MKKFTVVFAICFVVVFQAMAADRPIFVKTLTEFQQFEPHHLQGGIDVYTRSGSSRPFGWGTGTYRPTKSVSIPFEWFAWTNVDGYFQMKISTLLNASDMGGIMVTCLKKGLTHISLSNDWTFGDTGRLFCQGTRVLDMDDSGRISRAWYDNDHLNTAHCGFPRVLRYYLNILHERVPQLTFEVAEDME